MISSSFFRRFQPRSSTSFFRCGRFSSSSPDALIKDPYPHGHPDEKTVVVYGRPTTRVEKVLYILEELNVPYTRVHFVSPPPAYFSEINPMLLVPAIRDGSSVTMEGSNAICAYLAHKYGSMGMFPEDSLVLGRALQWSEFMEGYLATPRLNHVFHAVINKAYPPSLNRPGCPTDAEIDKSVTATVAAMKILDAHLSNQNSSINNGGSSGSSAFIADPGTFTFADAVAGPWVYKWYLHADEFGPRLAHGRFGAVARYFDRLAERPAFQRVVLKR